MLVAVGLAATLSACNLDFVPNELPSDNDGQSADTTGGDALADSAANDATDTRAGGDSAGDGTVPGPLTVSITPAHGATGVALDVDIELRFSRTVDHTTVITDGFCLMTATNEACVDGQFDSIDADYLVFHPSVDLDPDTQYHAILWRSVSTFDGTTLSGEGGDACEPPDACSTFTTTSPGVTVSVTPVHLATDVSVDTTIRLQFSAPMEPSSLVNNFALVEVADPQTSIPGSVTWPDPTLMVFTPDSPLGYSTDHVVGVADSARTADGRALQVDPNGICESNAHCTRFTTICETREVCDQCGTGSCEDVVIDNPCGCASPVAADNCDDTTYGVPCGDGVNECTYERREITETCNCRTECK